MIKPTRGRPKASTKLDTRSFGPIGDLIRRHRLELKLGLADVAKACECSVQFVSNIEHGRAPLPWEKVPLLAKALKISADELQTANLAIRADFKGFSGPGIGKKVAKPSYLKNMASVLAVASQDSDLQAIIQKYQGASKASRREFLRTAMGMLD